jgi:hypothetical protein
LISKHFKRAVTTQKHVNPFVKIILSVDEWITFAKQNPKILNNIAVSSGTSDSDYEKLKV